MVRRFQESDAAQDAIHSRGPTLVPERYHTEEFCRHVFYMLSTVKGFVDGDPEKFALCQVLLPNISEL